MDDIKPDTFWSEHSALKKIIEELNHLDDKEAACRIVAAAAVFLDLPVSFQQILRKKEGVLVA